MADINPISYREHARISIARHMQVGITKGLTGSALEDYVRLHAIGGPPDIFEPELRGQLYPKIRRPKRAVKDIPGQQVMFDIAQPKRPRKSKREPRDD